MKTLVLNAGSSSLKYALFSGKKLVKVTSGLIDQIGLKKSKIKNHQEALHVCFEGLESNGFIEDKKDISLVGHRIVHGGPIYQSPTIITKKVLKKLATIEHLAPLHNPHNIEGIEASQAILPHATHVGIFDTAFHATMPEKAYVYPLPHKICRKLHIRRYGFHGTSHWYAAKAAQKLLGKKNLKMVNCHIGNGSSFAAIKNGKSIDTSMGFTPLEGVPMGTRCGDIDPAIIPFLCHHLKKSVSEIEHMLNHEAGLKGLSEISSDMRLIYDKYQKNNTNALRTMDTLAYRMAKYIGSYATALGGLDVISFTAGIGENAWYLRRDICAYLKWMGLKLDSRLNKNTVGKKVPTLISKPDSTITVVVIPADEEKEIATQSLACVK